jgi:hypothetical protein
VTSRVIDAGRPRGDDDRMLIFITRHAVKPGRHAHLERLTADFLEFVEANEPRMLALDAYLDDAGDMLTLVQVHPDAESMEFHLQVAGDRIHRAFDVVGNDGVEVYGRPGETTRGLLEQIGQAGIPVDVHARRIGGFGRVPLGSGG